MSKTEEASIDETSDSSDEDDTSPVTFEYIDINNLSDLERHLAVSTLESIDQHRLKIHMMELGLRAWYLEPTRFIKPEVSIDLNDIFFSIFSHIKVAKSSFSSSFVRIKIHVYHHTAATLTCVTQRVHYLRWMKKLFLCTVPMKCDVYVADPTAVRLIMGTRSLCMYTVGVTRLPYRNPY